MHSLIDKISEKFSRCDSLSKPLAIQIALYILVKFFRALSSFCEYIKLSLYKSRFMIIIINTILSLSLLKAQNIIKRNQTFTNHMNHHSKLFLKQLHLVLGSRSKQAHPNQAIRAKRTTRVLKPNRRRKPRQKMGLKLSQLLQNKLKWAKIIRQKSSGKAWKA